MRVYGMKETPSLKTEFKKPFSVYGLFGQRDLILIALQFQGPYGRMERFVFAGRDEVVAAAFLNCAD